VNDGGLSEEEALRKTLTEAQLWLCYAKYHNHTQNQAHEKMMKENI
jgi:hypothetical protein